MHVPPGANGGPPVSIKLIPFIPTLPTAAGGYPTPVQVSPVIGVGAGGTTTGNGYPDGDALGVGARFASAVLICDCQMLVTEPPGKAIEALDGFRPSCSVALVGRSGVALGTVATADEPPRRNS